MRWHEIQRGDTLINVHASIFEGTTLGSRSAPLPKRWHGLRGELWLGGHSGIGVLKPVVGSPARSRWCTVVLDHCQQ
ncbi:hypothetical protein M6B38_125020 [Iris pallida]|uniref:Uncharacterized protein n=1 Tax=Iris pallida TaxID=29817 RepID=A0AAX6GWN9_IRIPA|nr:hypothetical protein M6B38_125020 [Iris pallida]